MSRQKSPHYEYSNEYSSPAHSPRNQFLRTSRFNNHMPVPSQYTYYNNKEDTYQQANLSQKIHKLKKALKASQRHNQELNSRKKQEKDIYHHQLHTIKEQLRKYKKRYKTLQNDHDKVVNEYQTMKIKSEYENKEKKQTTNQKNTRIKQLQSKISQLQECNTELTAKLNQKINKIGSLEAIIQKLRTQEIPQLNRRLQKSQNQYIIKNKQSLQYLKQLSTARDVNKQLSRKLEKCNQTIYQQGQRSKQSQQQSRQQRKVILQLQKQLNTHKQHIQQSRLQNHQKISIFEKHILEKEFEKQRVSDLLSQQAQKTDKLSLEFEELLLSYNELLTKYNEVVGSQYDIQKEFQRELNFITKELTRRYNLSRNGSAKASSTTYSYSSPNKKDYLQILHRQEDTQQIIKGKIQGFHAKY